MNLFIKVLNNKILFRTIFKGEQVRFAFGENLIQSKYDFKFLIVALILILSWSSLSYSQLLPTLGGQRAGISSVQFLKIGIGGRATALGESFIAISNDASSLYWNPAAMVQFNGNEAIFSHTNWVVDIKHQFAGVVYRPTDVDAIGASFMTLHMDDMKVTTELMPFGTGEYFSFGDIAIGLSYAHKFTEQFSFGATVKYVRETLDKIYMDGIMVDLGTYYWTGLGTSRFAVTVSNFGSQLTPKGTLIFQDGTKIKDFQSFSPPTMFRIGFAVEPLDKILSENYRMTTSIQLNHPNDNSENVGLGLEFSWREILTLRGGYRLNVDEQNFSFGFGIQPPISFAKFNFDYSYLNFTNLGSAHRFSIILGIE